MPELPEVETMAAYLSTHIVGSEITSAESRHYRFDDSIVPPLVGSTINKVTRRAKYLLFYTNNGIIVTHHRFTGYWDLKNSPWTFDYLEYPREATDSDVRMTWNIRQSSGNETVLRFHDMRCLAVVKLNASVFDPDKIPEIGKLGPEVVSTQFMDSGAKNLWTFEKFCLDCRRKVQPIKQSLLDQTFQAGIGNIYACESLWRAKINPFKYSQTLDSNQYRDLYEAVKSVILEGLNFKVKYDNYIKVFRVKNCSRCNSSIVRGEIQKRGTYYCPTCQADKVLPVT